MKRMLGITVIALGLLATGAFLSSFISSPFASNQPAASFTNGSSPVLVNTGGAQISILPSMGADGRPGPVVINVGAGSPVHDNGQVQAIPAIYRPTVQSAYEPEVRPRRVVRTAPEPAQVRSRQRTWQQEALIIGGSAAAGAGIGAVAGGKKGAAIGAVSGGVAGLVYDLATRK